MPELYHIISVALFDVKLALRTKAILYYLLFMVVIVTIMITEPAIDGDMLSRFPGEQAAVLIVWSSMFKILLSPFFAPVFILEDRQCDSFMALYPRPFSNASYLLGKLMGYTFVMTGFDYVCMILLFIFNTIMNQHAMSVWPYLLYPMLITVPLCIFVFGLLVVLGHIWYPLVYAGTLFMAMVLIPFEDVERLRYLDLGGITLPLAYSTFTGFFNLGSTILQRCIYVFGGLGMVFVSIHISERQRSSLTDNHKRSLVTLSLLFFAVTFLCIQLDHHAFISARNWRDDLRKHHNEMALLPAIDVQSCNLDIIHNGNSIETTALLTISNPNTTLLNRFALSLNSGFTITDITSNNTVTHTFENGIIDITTRVPLRTEEALDIKIVYTGSIDNEATYLHIPEDYREHVRREGMLVLGKEVASITSNYVFLPPEAHWYPEALPNYPVTEPGYLQRDLTQYSLSVKTDTDLTALSQGRRINQYDDVQSFAPEQPLTQISLAIAPFNKTAITVDDIEYAFYWVHKDVIGEHENYTKNIIRQSICEFKEYTEEKLAQTYPFKRFQIVQSPIHYFGYNSPWDMNGMHDQPETYFTDEWPHYIRKKRKNILYLSDALSISWLNRTNTMSTRVSRKLRPSSAFNTFTGFEEFTFNPFIEYGGLFPQYAVFNRGRLTDNDLFNLLAVNKLRDMTPIYLYYDDIEQKSFSAYYQSLDRAIYTYQFTKSLSDVIHDSHYHTDALDIILIASSDFFKYYAGITGANPFDVETKLFEAIKFPECNVDTMFNEQFGSDIHVALQTFSQITSKARLELSDAVCYSYMSGKQMMYNTRCIVKNNTDSPCIATYQVFNASIRNFDLLDIYFEPYSRKELGIITNEKINDISLSWSGTSIETPVPSNTPPKHQDDPLHGARNIDIYKSIEIVMDNVDVNCHVISNSKVKFLKDVLTKDQKNGTDLWLLKFNGYNAPSHWTLAYPSMFDKHFYGPLSSIYYRKAGDNNSAIEYTIDIPEPGTYRLDISAPLVPSLQGNQFSSIPDLLGNGYLNEITVRVFAGDGMHEDTTDIANASAKGNMWAYVGTYNFSDTTAIIQIMDKTRGNIVIADAVRLRLVDNKTQSD